MYLLEKEDFSEADINDLIANQVEESIHVDFKEAGALSMQDKPKKEITKDVSAFANSDGGLIFYGIVEANHVASSIDFVDGNRFTKEWIEHVISDNIQQRILELKIIPVRFGNQVSQTVYVVKIPKSERSPHMCKDQRYYRRYNFESVPMEEYEVRNLYFQITVGKLSWRRLGVSINKEETDEETYNFILDFQIENQTSFFVDKYKLACQIENGNGLKFSFLPHKEYDLTRTAQEAIIISTTKPIPVYPSETLTGMNLYVKMNKRSFLYALGQIKITLSIFNQHSVVKSDITSYFVDLAKERKEVYYG